MSDLPLREQIRSLVNADDPASLAGKARAKRWNEFSRRFPDIAEMRVLDLGGTPRFWRLAPTQPADVTIVNLTPEPIDERWMRYVLGDACTLEIAGEFDLVVSNSLIEHVGGHERRTQLAQTIRAAAPHYWVQTPYRYFPIEPHWVFPGGQFLPVALAAKIPRHWKLAYERASTDHDAVAAALEIELLSATEMRHYFPDADLWRERFAAITKSLVSVR
jgi:hypothetical protein